MGFRDWYFICRVFRIEISRSLRFGLLEKGFWTTAGTGEHLIDNGIWEWYFIFRVFRIEILRSLRFGFLEEGFWIGVLRLSCWD